MKKLFLLCIITLAFTACTTASHKTYLEPSLAAEAYTPNTIEKSLFDDKSATISEENIQKILNGKYSLPAKARVALVKLNGRQSSFYYRSDEDFLKTQQSYMDMLSDSLKTSNKVTSVSVIPQILLSKDPSFLTIREAAVRTQADLVAVFAINSDIYYKYKAFSGTKIKAFATVQFIILDVRTGLIPFSKTVTRDFESQKVKDDYSESEAAARVKNEAVLLAINDIGAEAAAFLNNN